MSEDWQDAKRIVMLPDPQAPATFPGEQAIEIASVSFSGAWVITKDRDGRTNAYPSTRVASVELTG